MNKFHHWLLVTYKKILCKEGYLVKSHKGRLGGSDFGSGHDLTVHGLEPHMGLCADSSEPGACFRFCVSLSLCPSFCLSFSLPLSLSKINKH